MFDDYNADIGYSSLCPDADYQAAGFVWHLLAQQIVACKEQCVPVWLSKGNDMRIGEQLRTIRKGVGLTQDDVAEKLSVTRQAISNWEQGKTIPDLYSFARLAAFFQFSPDEFLLGKTYFKGMQKMKTNFSDAQIEKLICNHYPDANDLTPLSGGLVSQTFSFQSGKNKYVFQIGGKRDDYDKQLYITGRYRNAFPLREVLYVKETDNGTAYCISRFIDGHKLFDFNDRERRELSLPVLDALSQMAQAEIPANVGYGRFDANGYAPFKTWSDFNSVIYNDDVCDWSALLLKGFSDVVVRKAIGELKGNISYVLIGKPSLVNGDVGSYNVIAKSGEVTGFIDCGSAIYGDPLYAIANLLFWNEDKLQDLITEIKRLYLIEKANERKLYCYVLRIGLAEIYNTVILNEIGYDVYWVNNRLDEVLRNGL